MKQRYWLFQRGVTFYLEDAETRKKESLKTRNPKQAERLRMGFATQRRKNPCSDSYHLLWEIGAAQSDPAGLTVANIDWRTRGLSFQ